MTALLSACAGTARGSKASVFSSFKKVEVIDYSLSKADALVVIRYPAIIHADAEESYFHAFSINAIGGEVPPANRTKKVTTRIAQSVIAKSNYYVMSLYRELQKDLPENTVLLSPHIILWDKDRGVYSRPILATEQILHGCCRNDRLRPKRIDGDALISQFLRHSQDAHAHAEL